MRQQHWAIRRGTDGAEEDRKHWSRVAGEWTTWARAPNHDAFWAYRDSLAAFIGGGDGQALDIGCGEGRVSRELMALGYTVTEPIPSAHWWTCAAQAKSAHDYAVAGATRLPFEDCRFDLVVAYNVLMDVDDVPAAVREIGGSCAQPGDLLFQLCTPSRITAASPTWRRTRHLSFKTPTSAGNASKVSRSVMACGCILLDGRTPSNSMLRRWRVQGWQSRHFVNRCPSLLTGEVI